MNRQKIAQGFARQIDRDVFLIKARISQNFAQGTFEFAHVGAHILGHEKCHFLRHLRAFYFGFVDQNSHPHFQLGRLNGHGQAGIEA